jgi:hypothetical protein
MVIDILQAQIAHFQATDACKETLREHARQGHAKEEKARQQS